MSTLAAGTRLGRYRLGEVLGEGGSARVYRARDLARGDEVAVKLFHAVIGGPEDVRRHREFSFLMRLEHPNLVRLRDTGVRQSHEFLVMELIDGPTLEQRLRAGTLPPAAVTELGAALCDALDYVHAHGITHRDVKPGNVLLGSRPRLTDFGIARVADTFWATDELVGTPSYLAPEQLLGEPVGPPADIYALGLVLLEALTGRREYPGADADTTAARLDRPPAVPADLPYGLPGLLTAMTALDPFDRPGADEAAAALRSGAPVLAPGDLTPARRSRDRRSGDRSSRGRRSGEQSSRRRRSGEPRPNDPATVQRGTSRQPATDRRARDRRTLTAAVGVALTASVLGVITVPMLATGGGPMVGVAEPAAEATGPTVGAPGPARMADLPRLPVAVIPHAIPPATDPAVQPARIPGLQPAPAQPAPAQPAPAQPAPAQPIPAQPIPAQLAPAQPVVPAQLAPAQPVVPAQLAPAQPVVPAQPVIPAQPERPARAGDPARPIIPARPERQARSGDPVRAGDQTPAVQSPTATRRTPAVTSTRTPATPRTRPSAPGAERPRAGTAEGAQTGVTTAANTAAGGGHDSW